MTDFQYFEAQKAYERVKALLVEDGQSEEQAQNTLENLVVFVMGSKLSKEQSNVYLAKFIEAILKGDKPQC